MRILTALFLSLLVIGCDSGGPSSGVGDLQVTLHPYGRDVLVATVEKYGCTAYTLVGPLTQDSSELMFTVEGVRQPELCSRAFTPARRRLSLAGADLDGYTLSLRKDGETDVYEVVPGVNAGTYSLRSVRSSFSEAIPPIVTQ